MKRVTAQQLAAAFSKAPNEINKSAKVFITRGLAEYKRIALQTPPWRVRTFGGGVPVGTGNLKEQHQTKIENMHGSFGVTTRNVPYALYVHEGTRRMNARPWLQHAKEQGDAQVEKLYQEFARSILKIITP